MMTLIIFLAVLSILVISHEWGHFITARKNGITVHEFGFGFPPRLFGIQPLTRVNSAGNQERRWHWVWGSRDPQPLAPGDFTLGTVYSFNIIPLGGFVKIKGENAGADGADDPDSFATKKSWQKALVLTAGVGMNIILAAVLLSVGFMIGLPQLTDSIEDSSLVKNRRVQVLQTIPGKPAEAVGIRAGDAIIKIGELERPRIQELQNYIDANRNRKLTITVAREGTTISREIIPTVDSGKGVIGVAIAEVGIVRYPPGRAVYHGVVSTGVYLKEIVKAFYALIKGLVLGQGVGNAVSGPVGVAVMTGQVARLGLSYLIQFTALLSLNLAVLNILPIPALDGGRLLFVLIGQVIRRPVSPKYEQLAHTIGFALLLLLVVVVTVRDLGNFKGFFSNVVERIF